MQKFLLGAVLGGLTGLILGAAFALGSMLLVAGLSERAASVIALCGGAAGFVGMFIGAVSGAVSGAANAAGGGRARNYVAAIAAAFAAGIAGARSSFESAPGGWPILYAAGAALAAATALACVRRYLHPAMPALDAPRHWRRFAQFRLSTLLALFVLVGALLSSLVSRTALEVRAIAQLRRHGAGVNCATNTPSWQSFLLGDASGERDVAESVDLHGALFGDDDLTWVRYLADVRCVDLQYTNVTDAGLIHLRPLGSLESLSLGAAAITDAGLQHLGGLGNLTYLSLSGAAITDAGMEHLKALRKLKSLDLRGTRITDAGIPALAALDDLEVLALSGTSITDAGIADLRGIKKLKILELSGTGITDASVPLLENLPTLDSVSAWNTRITSAGQLRLQQIYLKAEARRAASLSREYISKE